MAKRKRYNRKRKSHKVASIRPTFGRYFSLFKPKKRQSRFKSVFKAAKVQKEKQSTIEKQKRQRETTQKRELQKIIRAINQGNVAPIKKRDYFDSIYRTKLREGGLEKNTARIKAAGETYSAQPLSSSWIQKGEFTLSNKGDYQLTITVWKVTKHGALKTYEYTYQVSSKKVWEEMTAAVKAGGHGAGTIFHKYYPQFIHPIPSLQSHK